MYGHVSAKAVKATAIVVRLQGIESAGSAQSETGRGGAWGATLHAKGGETRA